MVYGSTSFVPLLKGREQQDAVTGLERDLDRAHLLAHVLRHALDGAAPQVGEQLRTGIVRDRDTAAHARTHIGGDLLHGIECNLQIFLCLFLEKLNMPQNTPVTKAS